MNNGFVRVGAANFFVKVGNCEHNAKQITEAVLKAEKDDVKLLVFPELSLTGCTCGDLFFQSTLISRATNALLDIAEKTKKTNVIICVGLPVSKAGSLYNSCAVVFGGKILGIVPKTHIKNYGDINESRYFCPAPKAVSEVRIGDFSVPFGKNLIFDCGNNTTFSAELCDDLWAAESPSSRHATNGALIIANLSARCEIVGRAEERINLIKAQSLKCACAYVYSDATNGESTTDLVFSGHNIIAENGSIIKEAERFTEGIIYTDIDVERLLSERRKASEFSENDNIEYKVIYVPLRHNETGLVRRFEKNPFVPTCEIERDIRCKNILEIQSRGLAKRFMHTGAKTAVIGVSGGLDSTLALLVTVKAFDILNKSREDIIGITMPCFGTSSRTYNNSRLLMEALGITVMEISIKDAVFQHFKDINQNPGQLDVTYENSQARERTQVLMDIANKNGGLVIGTGDLSELALGFATYNGDHMSMYGVNASIPKILARHIIDACAKKLDKKAADVLNDILNTPVSPELLPSKDGGIDQQTESIIGPYELHDFFLYYVVRYGFSPKKVLFLAECAFKGEYDRKTILNWEKLFYKRFFSQQFKRSCLPDGPKVGSVGLSPRGAFNMPSDADAFIWQEELNSLD